MGTLVDGRTAVITGAGSGIGRALAQRLSRHGCPVVISDWNEENLEETAASLEGPVLHRVLDVRDRQAQMALAADAVKWAPQPFGAVVNNAGVTVSQLANNASPEDDEWVMDVNYWGVVHGTRAWLPILVEQGSGTIANVSSVFGLMGWPAQSSYCASKAAVRGYTESLRHELRDSAVNAAVIHPGGVNTSIVENARFREDDKGNTDRTVLEQDFKKVARTSPARAARAIHKGINAGRARILIGPDAYMTSAITRLLPVRYFDLVAALEPVIRR